MLAGKRGRPALPFRGPVAGTGGGVASGGSGVLVAVAALPGVGLAVAVPQSPGFQARVSL